jgi:hypothetical protein
MKTRTESNLSAKPDNHQTLAELKSEALRTRQYCQHSLQAMAFNKAKV